MSEASGEARELVAAVLRRCDEASTNAWNWPERERLVGAAPPVAREALLALVDAQAQADDHLNTFPSDRSTPEYNAAYSRRWNLCSVVRAAFEGKTLPLDDADLTLLAAWLAHPRTDQSSMKERTLSYLPYELVFRALDKFTKKNTPSPALVEALRALMDPLSRATPQREATKFRSKIEKLVGAEPTVELTAGEAWTDVALHFLERLDGEPRKHWNRLLAHCQQVGSGHPTAKWMSQARALLDPIGEASFTPAVLPWLSLFEAPRTVLPKDYLGYPLEHERFTSGDAHQQILKGLIQCITLCDGQPFARQLTQTALAAYKKLPLLGPRSLRIGNACVWTLARIGGGELAGLALLRVRVKARAGQKALDDALTDIAERTGVSRDDLDELGVPAYGFDGVGVRHETLGDFSVVLTLSPQAKTELSFSSAGKAYKSVPAAVKQSHKDDLAELKEAAEDAEVMLRAQRQRLDGLFGARRVWPLSVWRERYLDHPLLGVLARRLIWSIRHGGELVSVIAEDDALVDSKGRTVTIASDSEVSLWHPVDVPLEAVLGWREFLEQRELQQPFKQAHREVYLITDAERTTGTYSNRFAAHIVKQAPFNALCRERGWNTSARLQVDADLPPPAKDLRAWDLRAEFWVSSIGEETTDTGSYVYLTTDQVRFYPRAAAQNQTHATGGGYRSRGTDDPVNHPIPLEQIPSLVLSETLRDADLFASVASVGNDPSWTDGGAHVAFREYWESFSFGELGEQAKTRRAALERLLPRLKIGPQCELAERFLIVRGKRAVYEIHLGSANVRMRPSGHHLCIVRAPADTKAEAIRLPFDGDAVLTTVLSKALLLARDDRITDPSISSQIERGSG